MRILNQMMCLLETSCKFFRIDDTMITMVFKIIFFRLIPIKFKPIITRIFQKKTNYNQQGNTKISEKCHHI